MSNQTEFTSNVNRYVDLEDEIARLSAQARALKREQGALSTTIIAFMKSVDKPRCETETMSLTVSETDGQASLSLPLLRKVFSVFFASEPGRGDALVQAIQTFRKESVQRRVRLKKRKITRTDID